MSNLVHRALLAIACAVMLSGVIRPAQSDTITVLLDQASILRLPEGSQTIVIGNPLVVDGTLQAGGLLVLTGKGYGTTNLIALNGRGDKLAEHTIKVAAPRDGMLTVFRGVDRETWSCAPRCERSVMPGDSDKHFETAAKQFETRNSHALGQPSADAAK